MKDILIATNNKNKLREFKEMLTEYNVLSLKEINFQIEVEEDGKTFKENALKKAKKMSEETGYPCIADDSGLCIKTFKGWPGVLTDRFLGEEATAEEKNKYILNKMNDLEERKAEFVCDLAYYFQGTQIFSEGIIEGKISKEIRGNNGFGFDSIFELENGKTMSEITMEEKNKISARKIAIEKLKYNLKNI